MAAQYSCQHLALVSHTLSSTDANTYIQRVERQGASHGSAHSELHRDGKTEQKQETGLVLIRRPHASADTDKTPPDAQTRLTCLTAATKQRQARSCCRTSYTRRKRWISPAGTSDKVLKIIKREIRNDWCQEFWTRNVRSPGSLRVQLCSV